MRTIPKNLPPLSYLLDDIAHNEKAVCEFLQVSPGMLRRWKKHDHAPRAYMLALFFVSKWRRSQINCEAENAARHWARLARCYKDELSQMNIKKADAFWQGVKWASLGQIPPEQPKNNVHDTKPSRDRSPIDTGPFLI